MGQLWAWVSVGLFICLLGGLELGRKTTSRKPDEANQAEGALSGMVYGLLTLLLSFSFSLAIGRFEARRHLIVDEANAIGTAYLRLDLLPAASRQPIKSDFIKYVDTRLAYNEDLSSGADQGVSIATTNDLQAKIWAEAMKAYETDSHESTRIQLTPALNAVFDLAASRSEAADTRLPWLVFLLLASLSVASAVLAGRALGAHPGKSRTHQIVFAAVIVFVVYVIADLDDPRQGFIRVDRSDQVLKDLRATMH